MNDPDHVVRANPHVVPSAVRNTGGTECPQGTWSQAHTLH